MFTLGLDHLHILIMLIIAFFSVRAYNNNTLAIEYQPQEEKVQARKEDDSQDVLKTEESCVESSEMKSEEVEEVKQVENSPSVNVDEVDPIPSIDVEQANSANVQSDISLGQNKHIEINTVQGSLDRIDDESEVASPSESLEKEEDQESTLIRGESRIQQEQCDEEQNVECSSGESSSGSSSGYPGLSQEEDKESRREKRKRIQKAKKVQKKNIRREQQRGENQVELIVIQ